MWNSRFRGEIAPALLSGVAAHASAMHASLAAAGVGLLLATHGHAAGWPLSVGGSQAIADAMGADVRAHGGEITTGVDVRSLAELPSARATLLDTSPRDLLRLVGDSVPNGYRRRLERFEYGQGVAKVDFAVDAPIPWSDPLVSAAGTVHLGGSREAIAAGERQVRQGRHAAYPFTLVSQPTLFDPSRAPEGQHIVWAYAHVPAGSTLDATETISRHIERYAPGFRDTVLACAAMSADELSRYNPNDVDGDISGGAVTIRQLLSRPVLSPEPWRTPLPGVYLCSASTPPGPSVHGMNGWFAARSALFHSFGVRKMPNLADSP